MPDDFEDLLIPSARAAEGTDPDRRRRARTLAIALHPATAPAVLPGLITGKIGPVLHRHGACWCRHLRALACKLTAWAGRPPPWHQAHLQGQFYLGHRRDLSGGAGAVTSVPAPACLAVRTASPDPPTEVRTGIDGTGAFLPFTEQLQGIIHRPDHLRQSQDTAGGFRSASGVAHERPGDHFWTYRAYGGTCWRPDRRGSEVFEGREAAGTVRGRRRSASKPTCARIRPKL